MSLGTTRYKAAADKIGFKALAPADMADTMRQGGTLVFKGKRQVLAHVDAKVGDNCEIDSILAAAR